MNASPEYTDFERRPLISVELRTLAELQVRVSPDLAPRERAVLRYATTAAVCAVEVVDRVGDLLLFCDRLRFGLPISQLDHARQAASRARRAGADPEIVIAL